MPPMKIGVEDDSGRYTPTANASAGIPAISSTTAIITPSSTSAHGNLRSRMPFDDVAETNTALGALEFFDVRTIGARLVNVPLMPGSTSQTALPVHRPRGTLPAGPLHVVRSFARPGYSLAGRACRLSDR